jgi:hypothetical protein
MKPILFTFAFAATLAAQNFIQMSDPQFGRTDVTGATNERKRVSGQRSIPMRLSDPTSHRGEHREAVGAPVTHRLTPRCSG